MSCASKSEQRSVYELQRSCSSSRRLVVAWIGSLYASRAAGASPFDKRKPEAKKINIAERLFGSRTEGGQWNHVVMTPRGANRRASVGAPDTIYTNGKFLKVDPLFGVAGAVAVRDGRFVAVGKTDEISTRISGDLLWQGT